MSRAARLREVASVFGRLGVTCFGGPAAHLVLMERECVTKRGWLTRAEFLELLAAAQALPGPTSTELALLIGVSRAGLAGLLVAGACFVTPAVVAVCAIAAAYTRWSFRPMTWTVFGALEPVVLAVLAHAVYTLAKDTLRSPRAWAVALGAATVALAGAHPVAVLALAAAAFGLTRRAPRASVAAFAPLALAGGVAASAAAPFSFATLFGTLLATGATLHGSGYALLAFLRADFVVRLGWLSERQVLDAFAVGQVTPGPVFTAATFVGWVVAGPRGALVATVAIFLPAFVLAAASGPMLARLRRSEAAREWLAGAANGSLALLAVSAAQLAASTFTRTSAIPSFALALALLVRRVNVLWLLLGAVAAGVARALLAGRF